ncbi:MAG: EpsI family protein [Nitrospirae bacterium]|nr:MAG: EpsI family protein [Nitrospirota bacterium]
MGKPGILVEQGKEGVRFGIAMFVGLIAVLVLLLGTLYRTILYNMSAQWYGDPNYSHGFLVPLVAVYFAWKRREQLLALQAHPSRAGIGLLGIGLLMFIVGSVGADLYLQRSSLIVVIAGLVLLILGRDALRMLALPIAFLFFMVPLPTIVMNAIAFPLQMFAAKTAAFFLFNFGIPVLREGNVIVLARTTLEVAEACSGIRSLQALLAIGTVYAYFTQSDLWKRWTLVLLTVPIAIAANAFRVGGTGVLADYWGAEAAVGFYHTFEGWLVFVMAFILLFASGAVLSKVGVRQRRSSPSPVIGHSSPVVRHAVQRWPFFIAIVLLIGTWGVEQGRPSSEVVLLKKPFAAFPLRLADQWEGRELGLDQAVLDVLNLSDYMMRVYTPINATKGEGQEQETGEESRHTSSDSSPRSLHVQIPAWLYVGYYQSQRTGATYHSPQNCLPGAGWQFVESTQVPVTVGGSVVTINQVVIQKGLDKQVILYWYHDRGRVIASEYWAKAYLLWDAATRNRTDGALVRISVPVVTTTDDAVEHARGFLRDLWPSLLEFMPLA